MIHLVVGCTWREIATCNDYDDGCIGSDDHLQNDGSSILRCMKQETWSLVAAPEALIVEREELQPCRCLIYTLRVVKSMHLFENEQSKVTIPPLLLERNGSVVANPVLHNFLHVVGEREEDPIIGALETTNRSALLLRDNNILYVDQELCILSNPWTITVDKRLRAVRRQGLLCTRDVSQLLPVVYERVQ